MPQRSEMTTKNEFSMTSLGCRKEAQEVGEDRKKDKEDEDGAWTANKKTSRKTRFALIVIPAPLSISNTAGGYCLWKAIKVSLLLQDRVVSDWLGWRFFLLLLCVVGVICTRKRFACRYWQLALIDWIHYSVLCYLFSSYRLVLAGVEFLEANEKEMWIFSK